jgi:hypothetical protein
MAIGRDLLAAAENDRWRSSGERAVPDFGWGGTLPHRSTEVAVEGGGGRGRRQTMGAANEGGLRTREAALPALKTAAALPALGKAEALPGSGTAAAGRQLLGILIVQLHPWEMEKKTIGEKYILGIFSKGANGNFS